MQVKISANTVIPFYYLLPIIIVVEGFVSIATEILTIRQLLPVAGGSVIVTSIVIGIFLLFLAMGYQHGGKKKWCTPKKFKAQFYSCFNRHRRWFILFIH